MSRGFNTYFYDVTTWYLEIIINSPNPNPNVLHINLTQDGFDSDFYNYDNFDSDSDNEPNNKNSMAELSEYCKNIKFCNEIIRCFYRKRCISENICREEDNTGYNMIQKNLRHAKRLQIA